jgi:hypothetical protein
VLLLLAALLTTTSAGCRMEKDGPDFRRYSRTHPFEVRKVTHRAGDLELTVLSASYSEVYTVLGSENWTARIDVRLANRGSRPLTVPMDSVGALVTGGSGPTAVYFRAAELPPGGHVDTVFSVPAGLTRVRPPLALVYEGVRMDL